MKGTSIVLIGYCYGLLVCPVAAFASTHGSAAAGSAGMGSGKFGAARSSIGVKYGTSPFATTYSSLSSGERIGVNCATDRQCRLLQLRTQGLALKEKDGGKLTPQHRAELQAQLDLVNAGAH